MSPIRRFWRIVCALWVHPETGGQVARFALGGAFCAFLNVLIVKIATERGIWYVGSVGIASLVSYSLSFGLHKYWAFSDHDTSRMQLQLSMHVMLGISNIFIDMALVYAFVELAHLRYIGSQVLAMLLIAVMNFFFYRLIIFKSPKEALVEAI